MKGKRRISAVKKALTFFIFLFSFTAIAQNRHLIDSLQKELKTDLSYDRKFKDLIDLSDQQIANDTLGAKKNAEAAISLAKIANNENDLAKAYDQLGLVYSHTSEFSKALDLFQSAEKIFKNRNDEKGRADFYLCTAIYYSLHHIETDSAHDFVQSWYFRAIEQYKKSGDAEGCGKAYYNYSFHFNLQNAEGDYRIPELEKADVSFKRSGNAVWEERIAGLLAKNYLTCNEMAKSNNKYLDAIAIAERLRDTLELSKLYTSLASLLSKIKEYEKADRFIKRAIEYKTIFHDTLGLAKSYNTLGNIYDGRKGFEKQHLEAFKTSLRLYQELHYLRGYPLEMGNIGEVYLDQGQLDSAIYYQDSALKVRLKLKITEGICYSYKSIGKIYLVKKDYKKAIEYGSKSLDIALKHSFSSFEDQIYDLMYRSYLGIHDYENAFKYYKIFNTIHDSTSNIEKSLQINDLNTKFESEKKDKEQFLQEQIKDANHKAELDKQRLFLYSAIIVLVLILFFAFYIYRGYKQKQKANVEISKQKDIIEEKNKDITDSINYAKRIQEAIFPSKEIKYKLFPEAFILFQPKDIVSGDFPWFAEKNGKKLIAAADCTGHGVPGAFMSMIGNAFLNEIVNEKGITESGEILSLLRFRIIEALKQTGAEGEARDGMDIAILSFDEKTGSVDFAGANNPLWIFRNGKMEEFVPDKRPIGYFRGKGLPFNNQTIKLNKGDTLYIFTDGFADQFGGPKGKKFKYKQFQETLIAIQSEKMVGQEAALLKIINEWKGNLEQVDDILVIGVRV